MAKLKQAFQRKEKKYLLSQSSYQQLREKIHPKMLEDKFGLHTIASIYYDTDDFALIRKSLEKPTYREKVRLRSYGTPKKDQKVFMEIKKNVKGLSINDELVYHIKNYHST